jgi:hypothetical protein
MIGINYCLAVVIDDDFLFLLMESSIVGSGYGRSSNDNDGADSFSLCPNEALY